MPRRRDVADTLAIEHWFWNDWRGSGSRARYLSTENFAAGWCYRELLDAHYMFSDCSLPEEDTELASLAGVNIRRWLSVKAEVLRNFRRIKTRSGTFRLRHPRTFLEWSKARANRDVARSKASLGGKAKRDKAKASINKDAPSTAPSTAGAVLQPASPSLTPTPSLLTDNGTDNPPNPPAGAGGDPRRPPIPTTSEYQKAIARIVQYAASKVGLRFNREERRGLLDRLKGGETEAQIMGHYQDIVARLEDEPEEPPEDDFDCVLPDEPPKPGDDSQAFEIVGRDDLDGRAPPEVSTTETSGRKNP